MLPGGSRELGKNANRCIDWRNSDHRVCLQEANTTMFCFIWRPLTAYYSCCGWSSNSELPESSVQAYLMNFGHLSVKVYHQHLIYYLPCIHFCECTNWKRWNIFDPCRNVVKRSRSYKMAWSKAGWWITFIRGKNALLLFLLLLLPGTGILNACPFLYICTGIYIYI